ncbi:MAG: hypothetical protein H7301_01745 [Cryobacterium sp.]|nr:hypothetical protein [Oligoflexia bacterium]
MKFVPILVFALMLTSRFIPAAKADRIRCSFTEPFLSTEYNMVNQTFTVVDSFSQYPKVFKTVVKSVRLEIKDSGVFQLRIASGKIIQKLLLNHQGSDGMSGTVFPYEVTWTGHQNLVGGCVSDSLPAKVDSE